MDSQDNEKLVKEEKYQKAVEAYKLKGVDLNTLHEMFTEVQGYRNASKYLDAIEKEMNYRKFVNEFKSDNCNWKTVAEGFKALEGYKKSEEYYSECQAKAEEQRKNPEVINEKKRKTELSAKYKKAIECMSSGNYERALSLFGEVGEYLDAKEKRRDCIKRIDALRRYKEEEESKKKRGIIIGILLLLLFLFFVHLVL